MRESLLFYLLEYPWLILSSLFGVLGSLLLAYDLFFRFRDKDPPKIKRGHLELIVFVLFFVASASAYRTLSSGLPECLNPIEFTSSVTPTQDGYAIRLDLPNTEGIDPGTRLRIVFPSGYSGSLSLLVEPSYSELITSWGSGGGEASVVFGDRVPPGRSLSFEIVSRPGPTLPACIDRLPAAADG